MSKNKVNEFIKDPKKGLYKLALPIVIAMMVQILYNIVDTAFVGRLGAEAIAALTFSFPLFFIMMALNSGLGVGMGSRISRYLGAKQKKAAENTAIHALILSLVFAFVIFVVGMIFLEDLFILFGAADDVIPLAVSYMSVIFMGVFFMFPGHIMSQIFTSQGDTKTPMKVYIAALIVNMVLDPIFIYVLGYGVRGAAIATCIAFVCGLLLSIYYIRKKSYLKINFAHFKFKPKLLKEILGVGLPASVMMILISIYIMFLNWFMAYFGTEYVAAFGLASKLESLSIMPIVAVSMSLMTLVGMFYGAKRYDLLKGIIWYGIKATIIFSSIVGVFFFVVPKLFLLIFTSDPELLSIGSAYLRVIVFTFPTMAIGSIISRALQGMGFGLPGLVINILRIIIVAIPLSFIFVFVLGYGYLSIAFAMVIGGIAAAILAGIWLEIKVRKLNHLEQ